MSKPNILSRSAGEGFHARLVGRPGRRLHDVPAGMLMLRRPNGARTGPDPRRHSAARTGAGLTLHDERAVCQVERLRTGRRTVTIERRTAGEVDLVGDQLRALRAAGRRTTGVLHRLSGKINRTGDILRTAALHRWSATVVVVAAAVAGYAVANQRDAGVGAASGCGDRDIGATADVRDAGIPAAAVGKDDRDSARQVAKTRRADGRGCRRGRRRN